MKETHKPKKSLGQNFLRDPKILSKIADFAGVKNTDTVLEVGPGEGLLTQILLERAEKVVVVEKDESLAAALKIKFAKEIEQGRFVVFVGDILNLEIQNIFSKNHDKDYILLGNIPYYITGAIFKKFLESEKQPQSITFVVQKEVAERIVARDGKESILSISIKAYGEPKYGGIIKAGSFYPRPKVDSAIISVVGIGREKLSANLEKKFFEILKAGFAHKRKLLIRNLSEIAGGRDLKEIFKKCGIEEKARAEDLKVEDWLRLTKEF